MKEVANPSSLFISDSTASGSAVTSIIEGSRPLLVEVQALTSPASFNYPQRVATGIDYKRLTMLLAVLERRVGIGVCAVDCFVNAVGGIKVVEPSCDLGLILAIASSIKNQAVEKGTVVIGEVGLGGEVRPVYGLQSRLKEAEKLGFKTAIVPHKGLRNLDKSKLEIVNVREPLLLYVPSQRRTIKVDTYEGWILSVVKSHGIKFCCLLSNEVPLR